MPAVLEGLLGSLHISFCFKTALKPKVSSQDEQPCPLLSSCGQSLRRAVPALLHSTPSNSVLALAEFYSVLTTTHLPWFCCWRS